jgi:hypothetical protein
MQSVAELMWTPVPCVSADTDIRRVARVLLDTGLPGLPVVDDDGKVMGFVSRSDILRAVVADPRLLLTAICALSQWSLEQIVQTYSLSRPQALACLLALDKLGIIELRANQHYRLKIDKTFRWLPDGPVMQFFREHAVADYFSGGFDGPGELLLLVHGQISAGQASLFNDRLQRLVQDFAQQQQADLKLPAADKRAYTVVVGMRSWLFATFREYLRQPG